jgi:hypothetical protein
VVFAVAIVFFLPTFGVPFLNWDDTYYVTQSLRTHRPGLDGFLQLWSSADIWEGRFLEFFPLRDSIYWLLWHAFGQVPWPFHAANILAHAVTSVLVLLCARALRFPERVAFGGALLFALHPMHVESVAWVSGLKDPMFTGFLLGSVICFVRWRERGRPWLYVASLVCLVASLLCKSIAICAPVLVLAIDRWLLETPWKRVAAHVAGPAMVAAGFAFEFVLMGRAAGVLTPPHGGSWYAHFFLSAWVMVRYLQQAIAPLTFALSYCFRPPHGFDLRWLGVVTVLPALAALFFWATRNSARLTVLIAWFVAALLPVANVVPFPSLMADRYLYLPSVASCIALAWLAWMVPLKRGLYVLGALVVIYAAISLRREPVWFDEANLWAEVVSDSYCRDDDQPTTAVAYLKYAELQRDPMQAFGAYRQGVEHRAFGALKDTDQCTQLINTAQAARQVNERTEAIRFARQSTVICPSRAGTWAKLASVAGGVDAPLAVDAAEHAHRLAPTPANLWQLGQARLAAGDEAGLAQIADAVVSAPQQLCGPFNGWAAATRHAGDPRLQAATTACPRN